MRMPLALFDLDNTLVDRQPFRRWATDFCRSSGLGNAEVNWLCDQDEDGFAPRAVVFELARARFSLRESVEELILRYREEYPRHFVPDPEVLRCLKSLRNAGWRIGIVTNGPPSQIEKIDRCGLRSLADGWCISAEVGWEKPDRRIFAEVIRRCGGDEGAQVWMTGDTDVSDIQGGRLAGCGTIWLSKGRRWRAHGYTPDVTVEALREAVDALLTMPDGFGPATGNRLVTEEL